MRSAHLIAHFPMDDPQNIGKNTVNESQPAQVMGEKPPVVRSVNGRKAAMFFGGDYGNSYMELDSNIFKDITDKEGITVCAWVCPSKGRSTWERIIDFGKGETGPYMFLTRDLRGVCLCDSEIPAASSKGMKTSEWTFVAFSVSGTGLGVRSNAGPIIYKNGAVSANGEVSQTASGSYRVLRNFFDSFGDADNFSKSYIGHSQFPADNDFSGAITDLKIYDKALSEKEVINVMCESLSDAQILTIAQEKFLNPPKKTVTGNIGLQTSLMENKVSVEWASSNETLLSSKGVFGDVKEVTKVVLTATLTCGSQVMTREFAVTMVPKNIAPYELTVHADEKLIDISDTIYGLFFEDINHAADGGIYAEMVQNRSFENFTFDTYDTTSGENGASTGRNFEPLKFWFGDLEKISVMEKGGLNEFFSLDDKETNCHYIRAQKGAVIYNHGYCDNNMKPSMRVNKDEKYYLTLYARGVNGNDAEIDFVLVDENDNEVSNVVTVKTNGSDWNKYEADVLLGKEKSVAKLKITFKGEADADMISLMPGNVWGAEKEVTSETANNNYMGNPNYRLRRDLVEALRDLHPTFMRFPGGCISEGSFIWDNVYDWKESVGDVAVRKENFNVWGYVMTMGLGYMEYFQLSEDLGAYPLPVMACGVLCQARSDYANPAGGKLRDKYISNFTDLIDFAISTDFEGNKWAKLRKDMGHEAPFELHHLGVGNENWGSEFFANFEIFREAIDRHMAENYPGYELTIVSTAGAQADDDAYKYGWKFLAGYMEGGDRIAFTDGKTSIEEDVTWYKYRKDHLDTIVDEHYYRANDYLIENADRYNYYQRAYKEDGTLDEPKTPKVFVGEYASNDKNTLAGAVAEAAVMTGFEKNSDVVRLAATAPLFNKVGTDGTYRWTPDCIWFDDDKVWRTPTYFVQQMFAGKLGKEVVKTEFLTYEDGKKKELKPGGGIVVAAEGDVLLKSIRVVKNNGEELLSQDFTKELSSEFKLIPGMNTGALGNFENGLRLSGDGVTGFYVDGGNWSNYKIELKAEKMTEESVIKIGSGLRLTGGSFVKKNIDMIEYCVGDPISGTGIKVFKTGKEGYVMGDYSSSVYAGNLRSCFDKKLPVSKEINVCVSYGYDKDDEYSAYTQIDGSSYAHLTYKLETYNRDVFNSVTRDEEKLYLKLVNTDDFSKKLKINFEGTQTESVADITTLAGDSKNSGTPNINSADGEVIIPVSSKGNIDNGVLQLNLMPNSVVVVEAAMKK